ncbi:MAG TPA: hypothetical protein VEJ18_11430 [Planctomycetota bacterium]|nr:hypothetical protein [Planctomycetota bacterium]
MKTITVACAALTALASSLAAQEQDGVTKVWVSASQWPDARSHATFAKDAVRLYGVEKGTDEQKALAIYYHAMRVLGHGGDYYQGPPGKEEFIWDNWMIAHCYSKALCEWWGWFLIDLWKAYHGNWSFDPKTAVARKVGLSAESEKPPVPGAGSHVQAALRWKDADGVDRWHLFDGNVGFFARVPGTDRIASPEEIKAGYPDILVKPHNPPHPYMVLSTKHGDAESDPAFRKFMGNTYPFAYSGARRRTRYVTDFDLRAGESLRRQWYDDGKAVIQKRNKDIALLANIDGAVKYMYPDGTPKDPYNFPVQRPYFKNYPQWGLSKPIGNGYSAYAPDLKQAGKGARSAKGIAVHGELLGAEKPSEEGEIVYSIRHIYPYAESFVRGTYVLRSEGRLAVDFSLDEGKTWIPVLEASDVRPDPVPFEIDLGKGRWDKDLPSTYNMPDRDSQFCDAWDVKQLEAVRFTGFQYLVRIRILAKAKAADVGLSSLRFDNAHQLNIGMLPTLLPGVNRITVQGASLAPGTQLTVEYAWMEGTAQKKHVETVRALPHVYEIKVEEKDPLKVKCLHQTLSVAGPKS